MYLASVHIAYRMVRLTRYLDSMESLYSLLRCTGYLIYVLKTIVHWPSSPTRLARTRLARGISLRDFLYNNYKVVEDLDPNLRLL